MFDGGSLKIMLTFPLKGVFNFIIFLFGFFKNNISLALDFRTFLENMEMSSSWSKILETGINVFKINYQIMTNKNIMKYHEITLTVPLRLYNCLGKRCELMVLMWSKLTGSVHDQPLLSRQGLLYTIFIICTVQGLLSVHNLHNLYSTRIIVCT